MNDINIRFIKLRKVLDMSQEEMGNIIGIKRSGVSNIEGGTREVTQKHIKLLCVEPVKGKYVNEEWLRTGKGEMFVQPSEEQEIADIVYELLDPKDDTFYMAVLELVRTYKELTPGSQQVIREMASKFLNNYKKRKGD